jgi:hypothetical protein
VPGARSGGVRSALDTQTEVTMRFLSKYGRFGVQIQPMITENYATGMTSVIQKPLYVMFHEGDLRPEERELAFAKWTWNGFYQEQDEVTMVAPDYRIGVFDSEGAQQVYGWTDEERLHVETQMVAYAANYADVIEVPRTLVAPPWPNYDVFSGTPEQLVALLRDQGHDIERTIQYEKAMQNRPDVLGALEIGLNGAEGFVDFEPDEEEVIVG